MKCLTYFPLVTVAQLASGFVVGSGPDHNGRVLKPRDGPGHGGHDMGSMGGAAPKDAPGGHDMASVSGGGMGGIGAVDLSNPYVSAVISTILKYGSGLLPSTPLNKTEELVPVSRRAGAKRTKFWYGPLTIETVDYKMKNPNRIGLDPQGTSFYTRAMNFPQDISILQAKIYPAREDGQASTPADGLYNHHTVLANASRRPPAIVACPGKIPAASMPLSIFASAGQEGGEAHYATPDDKVKAGFYMGNGDRVFLTTELVNYTNQTKPAWVILDMEYVAGDIEYDSTFEAISVTQCDGTGTGLKPQPGQKRFGAKSKEMEIQMDGFMFGIRGHLHDGGDGMIVSVNGKEVCRSKARYAGKADGAQWDTIKEMSQCTEIIPVKKGDKLLIEALYDLETHPARAHAGGGDAEEMGVVNLQFGRARNPA